MTIGWDTIAARLLHEGTMIPTMPVYRTLSFLIPPMRWQVGRALCAMTF
jgi:hypothetical protein